MNVRLRILVLGINGGERRWRWRARVKGFSGRD